MSLASITKTCACGETFQTRGNRRVKCDRCKAVRNCARCESVFERQGAERYCADCLDPECARCGEQFTQQHRERTCGPCRFEHDSKTSRCPYCGSVYVSHGESKADVNERHYHFKQRCKR